MLNISLGSFDCCENGLWETEYTSRCHRFRGVQSRLQKTLKALIRNESPPHRLNEQKMSLHRREQKVALQTEIRGLSWPPRVVGSYGTGTALFGDCWE